MNITPRPRKALMDGTAMVKYPARLTLAVSQSDIDAFGSDDSLSHRCPAANALKRRFGCHVCVGRDRARINPDSASCIGGVAYRLSPRGTAFVDQVNARQPVRPTRFLLVKESR